MNNFKIRINYYLNLNTKCIVFQDCIKYIKYNKSIFKTDKTVAANMYTIKTMYIYT